MSINVGMYMTEGMNTTGARGAYEDNRRNAVAARMAFEGENESAGKIWKLVKEGELTQEQALRIIVGKEG